MTNSDQWRSPYVTLLPSHKKKKKKKKKKKTSPSLDPFKAELGDLQHTV